MNRCIAIPHQAIDSWAVNQEPLPRRRARRRIPRHTARTDLSRNDPAIAPSTPRDNIGSILYNRRARTTGCPVPHRLYKFYIPVHRAPPPSRRRPWRVSRRPRVRGRRRAAQSLAAAASPWLSSCLSKVWLSRRQAGAALAGRMNREIVEARRWLCVEHRANRDAGLDGF